MYTRPLFLVCLFFALTGCLKEPEGGRTSDSDPQDDTGEPAGLDAPVDTGDPDDGDDPDDGEDTGDSFSFEGEYSSDSGISMLLGFSNFGITEVCDESSASFFVGATGALSGEGVCISNLVEGALSLQFSGSVGSNGLCTGVVELDQGFPPYEFQGEIGRSILLLSWEAESHPETPQIESIEGSAWASR